MSFVVLAPKSPTASAWSFLVVIEPPEIVVDPPFRVSAPAESTPLVTSVEFESVTVPPPVVQFRGGGAAV